MLSLPKPLYIASIDTVANRLVVLDREGKPHILSVVTSEYRFKAAVLAGREQEAVEVGLQYLFLEEVFLFNVILVKHDIFTGG